MPKELQNPLFYFDDIKAPHLFKEDFLFYNNPKIGNLPWTNQELPIQDLLAKWEPMKEELMVIFKNRRYKLAKPLLIKGSALFLQLLYWSNQKAVNISNIPEDFKELEIKPANLPDRLMFILQNPTLYHSFVQLSELFVEHHKTYSKHLVMKKRSNRK